MAILLGTLSYVILCYDTLSYRSALKHWLYYLNNHCIADGVESIKPVVDAAAVPNEMLDANLLGGFATYLSTVARGKCDPSRPLLAFKSADSYFSAIKTLYTVYIYSNCYNQPVFQKETWAHLRGKLATTIKVRVFNSGEKVINPQQASTQEDARLMGHLCVWECTPENLSFLLFNVSMVQVGGRGAEIAKQKLCNISTRSHVANLLHGRILQFHIMRAKTYKEQTCSIYSRASLMEWYEDFPFVLALNVIQRVATCTVDDGSLFPQFAHAASREDRATSLGGNRRKKSEVAGLWSSIFSRVYRLYENNREYFQDNNESLSSHLSSYHAKKRTAQDLANLGAPGLSIIFRIGWEARTVHSLFDYVTGSQEMDAMAARKLSGWTTNDGGHSPEPSDATLGTENQVDQNTAMDRLVEKLFASSGLSRGVINILMGSLLKYWPDFIRAVQSEPSGVFQEENGINQHPLIGYVYHELRQADIDLDQWNAWSLRVRQSFVSKNYLGMPATTLAELPDESLLDTRCMREHLCGLTRTTAMTMQKCDGILDQVAKLADTIRNMPLGSQEAPDNNNGGRDVNITQHWMSYQAWLNMHGPRTQISPETLFVAWHFHHLEKGYSEDLKARKARNEKGSNPLKQKFCRHKHAVAFMLDNYMEDESFGVPSRPSESHLLSQWKQQLESIAQHISANLGDSGKSLRSIEKAIKDAKKSNKRLRTEE